ncbi:MAG TPA: hypothetical protein VMV97_10685, partial [Sulfuriferula sp.]|nr:hypothetical protein [Sulfuriferula sp.]
SNQVFRFLVISQQAVQQFVAYGHYSSFVQAGSFLPNDRLHKNSYTLTKSIFFIMKTWIFAHVCGKPIAGLLPARR